MVADIFIQPPAPTVKKLSTALSLHRCSYKKMFWKYAANLEENTHAEVRFQQSEITLRHGCFPVNILLIFRTVFPRNTFAVLLLLLHKTEHLSPLFWRNAESFHVRLFLGYSTWWIEMGVYWRNKRFLVGEKEEALCYLFLDYGITNFFGLYILLKACFTQRKIILL